MRAPRKSLFGPGEETLTSEGWGTLAKLGGYLDDPPSTIDQAYRVCDWRIGRSFTPDYHH